MTQSAIRDRSPAKPIQASAAWRLDRETAIVLGMAIAYVVIMFSLMVLKHNAFNTRIHDFARFSQAIWNTLDGRFLYTSLSERTILGDHFSPIMALFAPLFWIWPNERVLFLVQTMHVAVAGLILYVTAREKRPSIALLVAVIYFLNPAVHEITLFELRRIVFGLPWLALGVYGLLTEKYRLMLFGLGVALLSKESVAIYVAMIGVYLVFIRREWRWGMGLFALGIGWAWLIGDVVIPYFNRGSDIYPQLYYYDHLGESYSDLVWLGLSQPGQMLSVLFGDAQLAAAFRVLFPFAFLVFLDFPLLLITGPYVILMFLSRDVDMFQLDKWYMTTITPILFAAFISGWERIPKRLERYAIGLVLITTLISFFVYSYAPLGGRFDLSLYRSTDRDRLSHVLIDRIPDTAVVESHPKFIPHLTHLNEVYHYLFAEGHDVSFIVMDEQIQFTPFGEFEMRDELVKLVSNPEYVVVEEGDGMFLFGLNSEPLPAIDIQAQTESGILLERVDIAIGAPNSLYAVVEPANSVTARPGDTIRVSVYWTALQSDLPERTVSVRLEAADGFLLAQQDQLPVAGYRPTSWWEAGDQIRDVYYLTVPQGVVPQTGRISLLLYDPFSQERVPFDQGDQLNLAAVSFEN